MQPDRCSQYAAFRVGARQRGGGSISTSTVEVPGDGRSSNGFA